MSPPDLVPPDELARLAAARRLLVITDFDGTLAPIVPDPPAATILPAARTALERLVEAGGRGGGDEPAGANEPGHELGTSSVVVAVLSGRDAADVARRVGVAGPRYLGQHGIEHASLSREDPGASAPITALDTALAAAGEGLGQLADEVGERLGHPSWLVDERKGASVGLHYRRAVDPERARVAILDALDAVVARRVASGLDAPMVMESRRVVELRPAGAFGKGEATRRLIAAVRPDAVLVLGDDRTDAEAFDVVRGWRHASNRPAMIVGVSGASETPPEVEQHADLIVSGPEAAAALLATLAGEIERRRSSGDPSGSA